MLSGKIFITGGAGYLSRAIYNRARKEKWEAEFTCFSTDDSKHVLLRELYPEVKCYRGDISDTPVDILSSLMEGHKYVIHAAAIKYVDLAEFNVWDTTRVNINGSQNVILAAHHAGVERTVGISTDKACEPINIYGMTKAVMERLFCEAAKTFRNSEFSIVRYGNVVASTGSVITLFRKQQKEGAVKITDPTMTRFWMHPDEAVDTVIMGLIGSENGTILVPSCRSMSILDIAKAAAPDMPIEIIGKRAGEKVYESLIHPAESVRSAVLVTDRDVALKTFWEIYQPPSDAISPPFALRSDEPEAGFIGIDEMREIIAYSETI